MDIDEAGKILLSDMEIEILEDRGVDLDNDDAVRYEMEVSRMSNRHLDNRKNWLLERVIDPYDVVGDNEYTSTGFSFTENLIEHQNRQIEKEVAKINVEITKRKELK